MRVRGMGVEAKISAVLAGFALLLPASPAGATFPGDDGLLVFNRAGNIWTAHLGPRLYTEKQLTFDGVSRKPRWSPGGDQITFNTKGGAIKVMSAGGSHVRTVTTRGYQPAWSPDGQRLAFVRVPAGGSGDIWTVPVAGGSATRLTSDGASYCGYSHPSFSPSGPYLVYMRERPQAGGGCAETQIVVQHLQTKARQVVPLFHEGGAAYYPIGRRADFTADGSFVVYLAADSCLDRVIAYDVSTGTQTGVDFNVGCEGGDQRFEATPTPSGGIATVATQLDGGSCVTTPRASRCHDDGWSEIDVRPRP